MADKRIVLDQVMDHNSTDEFINTIVRLFTSAEKSLHKTQTFADGFVFSHADNTSIDFVATKLKDELTSAITSLADPLGGILDRMISRRITLDIMKKALSNESLTSMIMTVINAIDIKEQYERVISKLINGVAGTEEKMVEKLGTALPISDLSATNPISMMFRDIDEKGFSKTKTTTDDDGNATGTEISSLTFAPYFADSKGSSYARLFSHNGDFSTSELSGAPRSNHNDHVTQIVQGQTRTAPVNPPAAATPVLEPLDIMNIFNPIHPKNIEKHIRKHFYSTDVDLDASGAATGQMTGKNALNDLIVSIITQISSIPGLVGQPKLVDGVVKYDDSLITRLFHAIPKIFPQGHTSRKILTFQRSTEIKATDPYEVVVNGIFDIKVVNMNKKTNFKEAKFYIVSKKTGQPLAVKPAGSLQFNFAVNSLPVKPGITLNGKAITEMTLPQISHAQDVRLLPELLSSLKLVATEYLPFLGVDSNIHHFSETAPMKDIRPYLGVTGKKLLGIHTMSHTNLQARNPLPSNANAQTKQEYMIAEIEYLYEVAGMTEHFNSLTSDATINGLLQSTAVIGSNTAAQLLGVVGPNEKLASDSFKRRMEAFEGSSVEVTVNGHKRKVYDILKSVYDFVKTPPFQSA